MKKIQIFVCSAIIAFSSFAASCNGGGSSSNVSLKSSVDTLSYAYGVNLGEQGLEQYLVQLGVLTDTTQLKMSYNGRISAESDKTKKEALEKEYKTKLDSAIEANGKNITAFISGLKEGIAAKDEKAPYIYGITVGNQIAKQMLPNLESQAFGPGSKDKLNKDLILSALVGVLKKEKPVIPNSAELLQKKMAVLQEQAKAKKDEELKKQYGSQIAAGDKFLAENKTKEGIVTTASGLQYKVNTNGTGAKPKATDRVKVNYVGKLLDGTVFDSSKEPVTFGVNQVIKGWTEALELMPVGSKWTIFVPYKLGYGSQDMGKIKPFSTLIFEVELLAIDNAASAPKMPQH
jgi:FKBP-type peptidyl-prolyl cis-trans isomerase FklB